MPEKTVDRRVRKTKKHLRQALTQLMQEKSIKNISVRELSDLADINRGTFYIHYRDVFDMLAQIENEMFESFSEIVNSYEMHAIAENPEGVLTSIYRFLGENADLCIALLGKNGDIAFLDRFKDTIRYKLLHEWRPKKRAHKKNHAVNFEYFYSFIISGCIGLIQCWLETGMKQTPAEIAALTSKILLLDNVDGIWLDLDFSDTTNTTSPA